jgi:threonine dehydrogenase-like Zn-dependent dehydrogenase
LGDQRIVTTLCPGGKERMRRLLAMVQHDRIDLTPLLTHRFTLEQLPEAFDLFSRQADGVMKVVIHPAAPELVRSPRRELATTES